MDNSCKLSIPIAKCKSGTTRSVPVAAVAFLYVPVIESSHIFFVLLAKKIFNRLSSNESIFAEIPVPVKSNFEAIARLTVNVIAIELLSGISAIEIAGLKQC